jgi:hypothetical protein
MLFQIIVVLNDMCFTCNVIYYIMLCCNMLFSYVMISCRWLSLKEIHEDDIKYWKREIPRLMCEMQSPRGVGQSVTECVVKPLRVEKSPVRNLRGQKIQPC